MKAMVLAAGLGTRLRPLTNDRPKALVEVAGRTLLDLTLARLRTFQIYEVIVNVHHFADMVVNYLQDHKNFGMRIEISREEELLDTGGGLKKALWFFTESDADRNRPFLLHNVDVLSTIDLAAMAQFHAKHGALATLAVQHRPTGRYLLFDEQHHLIGRHSEEDPGTEGLHPLAFNGIHILSPAIFPKLTETGPFSIIEAYLSLAQKGEIIQAYDVGSTYWRDLGRPEHILEADHDIASGFYATT